MKDERTKARRILDEFRSSVNELAEVLSRSPDARERLQSRLDAQSNRDIDLRDIQANWKGWTDPERLRAAQVFSLRSEVNETESKAAIKKHCYRSAPGERANFLQAISLIEGIDAKAKAKVLLRVAKDIERDERFSDRESLPAPLAYDYITCVKYLGKLGFNQEECVKRLEPFRAHEDEDVGLIATAVLDGL